jgi:hypothetical protein
MLLFLNERGVCKERRRERRKEKERRKEEGHAPLSLDLAVSPLLLLLPLLPLFPYSNNNAVGRG